MDFLFLGRGLAGNRNLVVTMLHWATKRPSRPDGRRKKEFLLPYIYLIEINEKTHHYRRFLCGLGSLKIYAAKTVLTIV